MSDMLPHYDREWRLQCALFLLEELNILASAPRRLDTRSKAEAFVLQMVPRSFRDACPRFHNQLEDDVLRNAIIDVTQILREQGYFSFTETAMPLFVSFQKAFYDGFATGRRKQVEEALLDDTRTAVRSETERLCKAMEKKILETLEEQLKGVVGVAFENLLETVPGSSQPP